MPNANATPPYSPAAREMYKQSLRCLNEARVPYLVGGAYALTHYTGVERDSKDIDLFVRQADLDRTFEAFAAMGYRGERTFPHWLGKVFAGDYFVDLIYSSANGIARVDDEWFEHARDGFVLEEPVKLCPPEEVIWSKAFIMERERFDGADIAHVLRATMATLDWGRLVRRFGDEHWRVLLVHLMLFEFIYPAEAERIPAWVLDGLLERERTARGRGGPEGLCRGTILSREQYLVDLRSWGYRDARLQPEGKLTAEEIAHWTDAIGKIALAARAPAALARAAMEKETPRDRLGHGAFQKNARRRPTLPHGCPCSTIGSEELDFRVRDGIG